MSECKTFRGNGDKCDDCGGFISRHEGAILPTITMTPDEIASAFGRPPREQKYREWQKLGHEVRNLYIQEHVPYPKDLKRFLNIKETA